MKDFLNDIEAFGEDFIFCDLQSFWQVCMSKMGKERLLTTTCKSITSEERKVELKCDVQIFNQQVKKQLVVNWLEKCYVGKPRKVVVAKLFPQEIKREDEEPTKDRKQQKNT